MKKILLFVLGALFMLISCTDETTVVNNCSCQDTVLGKYVFYVSAQDAALKVLSDEQLTSQPELITYVEDRNGKKNSALYFDGADSKVTIGYSEIMELGFSFSVSVWLKPDEGYGTPNPQTGWIEVLGRWENQTVGTSTWGINIWSQTGEVYSQICNSIDVIRTSSLKSLTVNKWTNLIYVFDKGTESIYIDGKLTNYNLCNIHPQKSTLDFLIGMRYNGTCQYKGALSDLYVFNRAISENEIKLLSK